MQLENQGKKINQHVAAYKNRIFSTFSSLIATKTESALIKYAACSDLLQDILLRRTPIRTFTSTDQRQMYLIN